MPDLRSGPPPRFRVEERGRQLVVVDHGAPARARVPDAPIPAEARWFPRRTSFDGSAAVTTRPFYDAAAPRTLRLDPGSARKVRIATGFVFAATLVLIALLIAVPLLTLPVLIALGQVRGPARRAITRWLDTVAREAN